MTSRLRFLDAKSLVANSPTIESKTFFLSTTPAYFLFLSSVTLELLRFSFEDIINSNLN